ncbi:hypothetical protein [Streptomyces sp. NRRL F-5650]|uniref:hypothetical protein n=1 Tax=Streptomyces sp. NRRL F-5650 TaxID=1463868 RepID=UPI0004C5836E|nr:hypothetical protein [Streptomyces sp. NRRL F-5650]
MSREGYSPSKASSAVGAVTARASQWRSTSGVAALRHAPTDVVGDGQTTLFEDRQDVPGTLLDAD